MFKEGWFVSDVKDSTGGGVDVGEIIKHKSGAVILKCPKCGALQFTHSPITGPYDAPTLSKRIQCGGGHCKQCAIWFSVDAGKTVIHEGPETKRGVMIPKSLRDAGVKTAPTIDQGE